MVSGHAAMPALAWFGFGFGFGLGLGLGFGFGFGLGLGLGFGPRSPRSTRRATSWPTRRRARGARPSRAAGTRRRSGACPTTTRLSSRTAAGPRGCTRCRTCKRVGAQICSLGTATGGLAGGLEAAGGAAQDEGEHPGPWLWQGGQWGAAAAEGGRCVSRLEDTCSGRCSAAARCWLRVRVRVRVRVSFRVRAP